MLALAAVATSLACSRGAAVEGEGPCGELRLDARGARVPVVVVVNDAMRRDRLGVYGGRAKTPAFDAFANENLRFDQAYAQAPWTRPSVATLLSGLLPSQHGVGMERGVQRKTPRAVPQQVVTLAELLRDAGYRTAAFVANPWLEAAFGYDQGFDVYDASFASFGIEGSGPKPDGVAVSERALAWLDQIPAGTPYFLYVHTLDSHRPYPALELADLEAQRERIAAPPPVPPTDAMLAELRAIVEVKGAPGAPPPLVEPRVAMAEIAYEKGIEHFDAALARLRDGVARRAVGARTAVSVTSDHGEAFFEHGYANHGRGLHDEELAVPLAMRLPGVSGPASGVQCLTGLVDVMPTLCTYLDLACPDGLAGEDLLAPHAGRRFLVSEAVGAAPRHRAIRNRRWKLLWQPDGAPEGARGNPWSLYDLLADPGEQHDRIGDDDPAVRSAIDAMTHALAASGPAEPLYAAPTVTIEAPVADRLRALGYEQ